MKIIYQLSFNNEKFRKYEKFFLISFFIFSLLIVGSISALIFYPDRTQNFIIETLNLETLLK